MLSQGTSSDQRVENAALRAQINAVWMQVPCVRAALQQCANILAAHLRQPQIRIWSLPTEGTTLELRGSAGVSQRLDGPHAHVAVGSPLIGEVASTGRPFQIVRPAQELLPGEDFEGVAVRALSAYPLSAPGRVLGVLGVYSPEPLSPNVHESVAVVADLIALGMTRSVAVTSFNQSEERLRLLVEATRAVGASLDYEQTLRAVARLVVPTLADWCSIYVTEGEAQIPRQLVVAHVDPKKVEFARELGRRYPPDPDAKAGALAVIRSGEPQLIPVIEDRMLEQVARDSDHLRILREVGMRGAIIVPLSARGRTFGAITFVSAESGRTYGSEDLTIARELADRAAYAVDNARLYRDAQEAIRTRDDFLTIASHELKTPLTPLHLHLESMAKMSKGASTADILPRMASKLEVMLRQVDRLERLVNGLLDLGHVVGGRISLFKERVDLSQLCRDVVDRNEDALRRAGCTVSLEVEDGIRGEWDRLRVEQIVTQLLSNAMKFGQGRVIRVSLKADDGVARLAVEDEGIGIRAQDQQRIFRRFERAVPSRHYGGFGLGLWMVKEFVDAMGGDVYVRSEPGRGATFVVDLPRTGAEPQAEQGAH